MHLLFLKSLVVQELLGIPKIPPGFREDYYLAFWAERKKLPLRTRLEDWRRKYRAFTAKRNEDEVNEILKHLT